MSLADRAERKKADAFASAFIHADLLQFPDHIRHGLPGDLQPLGFAWVLLGECIPRGDEFVGPRDAEALEQFDKAADARAVNGQYFVFLYEQLLFCCKRADGKGGETVLIQQLAISVQNHGELLFGHVVQIPDLVRFRIRMDGEEERLVQLGVKRADKVCELFKAQIACQRVAVLLVLLGQLFRKGDTYACGGLKHRWLLLLYIIDWFDFDWMPQL